MCFNLFRYEFKANYEEWVKSVNRRLRRCVPKHVTEAIYTTHDNIKALYKVRTEMRGALQSLLKVLVCLFHTIHFCTNYFL
jgi:hypothetical protein